MRVATESPEMPAEESSKAKSTDEPKKEGEDESRNGRLSTVEWTT